VKGIVGRILSASDEEIIEVYETLKKTPAKEFGKLSYIPELLPRLAQQYDKSDPGTLVALLTMNFLVLDKGDAIYVPADGIHAYLSGDIVECMARSDNVLNTGFCPRADRDSVETFTEALTFRPNNAPDAILAPKSTDKSLKRHTKLLSPPMSEFDMLVTALKAKETETIKAIQGPSIMIVTGGKGKLKAEGKEHDVKEGYVFFIGYNTEIELVAESGLETHIAFCEAR
jgi:mannose-6-phosphate isomerase